MSGGERRCRATRDDGSPCGAPSQFVDPETGLCPAHREGGRETMRERAQRGAEARHGKGAKNAPEPEALTEEELPPLESHGDAKARLELISTAVLTGRISDKVAHAATRAVREWVRTHEGELVSQDVEALRSRLEELEGELGKRPHLQREK